jgi:hypothetical protein
LLSPKAPKLDDNLSDIAEILQPEPDQESSGLTGILGGEGQSSI